MKIKVIDNFFTSDEIKTIRKELYKPKWAFAGGGEFEGDINLFWHLDDLEDHNYFSDILFKKIQIKLGIKANIKRCYANGQTSLQSGSPHMDDGDLTVLLFTEPWKFYWGGNLVFLDNNEVFKAITYKQNRVVVFDPKIPHYAEAPNKNFNSLRISLAWKLKNIIYNYDLEKKKEK